MANSCVPCVMTDTHQFYVRLCPCGVVHLSFGPAVIHATPETVVAIAETLRELSVGLRKDIEHAQMLPSAQILRFPLPRGSI